MKKYCCVFVAACCAWLATALVSAADDPAAEPDSSAQAAEEPGQKYLLRYKFQPGETLRWQVEHRAQIRTTVAGTTQTAETRSISVKAWKVTHVAPDGQITFAHSVESVDMRQKLTGRQEVRYNSQTDKEVPPGFEAVAKSVGAPLTIFTIDPQGTIKKRQQQNTHPTAISNQITAPLPEQAIAVGHVWLVPHELKATAKNGSIKKIKARQRLKLEAVKDGVATISTETQILSPISNPTIEAQVVQGETHGKIRFDIEAGRIISQQSDIDKRVVGQQGEASSLHYVNRFVEKLLPPGAKVAAKPKAAAGPQQPSPPRRLFAPPPQAKKLDRKPNFKRR